MSVEIVVPSLEVLAKAAADRVMWMQTATVVNDRLDAALRDAIPLAESGDQAVPLIFRGSYRLSQPRLSSEVPDVLAEYVRAVEVEKSTKAARDDQDNRNTRKTHQQAVAARETAHAVAVGWWEQYVQGIRGWLDQLPTPQHAAPILTRSAPSWH